MGNVLCCVQDDRNYTHAHQDEERNFVQENKTFLKYPTGTQVENRLVKEGHDSDEDDPAKLSPDGKQSISQGTIETVINTQTSAFQEAASEEAKIEDNLSAYTIPLDFHTLLDPLVTHKNEYESEITFVTLHHINHFQSKAGLVDLIEKTFAQEKEETKAWEQKLNKEGVVVHIKKGGSGFDKNCPFVRSEMAFNQYYPMQKVIEAIFSTDHRQKWDKDVLKFDLEATDVPNVVLNYQLNKSPMGANKDFYDKQVKFEHNGQLYIYYSAINNDLEMKPTPPKVDRARTIVGMGKVYRREEDGNVVYTMLMQCDLKIKITPQLIAMFLPNGLLSWSKKLNKYINDNLDKI